jgi:hypothetical protein
MRHKIIDILSLQLTGYSIKFTANKSFIIILSKRSSVDVELDLIRVQRLIKENHQFKSDPFVQRLSVSESRLALQMFVSHTDEPDVKNSVPR